MNCDIRLYAARVLKTGATERRDLVIGIPEFYCVGWRVQTSHLSWGQFILLWVSVVLFRGKFTAMSHCSFVLACLVRLLL